MTPQHDHGDPARLGERMVPEEGTDGIGTSPLDAAATP